MGLLLYHNQFVTMLKLNETFSKVIELNKEIREGSFGKLSIEGEWLKKEDKNKKYPPTIEREWEVLITLQRTGLVPKVKKEYPLEALYIEYIPSNTLEEIIM